MQQYVLPGCMICLIQCKARFFFICWITLPANLKNWDLKKKRILPDTTAKLFVFGLIRNHQENNYFEISLSFVKLCKIYDK